MKKLLSVFVPLLLIAIAANAMAQEETTKEKKGAGKKRQQATAQPFAITQLQKSLEKAELTEEQKGKVKEVFAKHKDKLVELQKSKTELLGADTIKKMNEARKAATAEGKKAKALTAAVNEAAGLTEEIAAKLAEITAKTQAVSTALKKDVLALLTKEQVEKAAIKLPAQGKKGQGKKKDKADADA